MASYLNITKTLEDSVGVSNSPPLVQPNENIEAVRDIFESQYTQIHDPIIGKRRLYSKLEILTYMRDQATLKLSTCSSKSDMKTFVNVIKRAEAKLKLLSEGKDVKIPGYYHAVKSFDAVGLILKSSIQSRMAKEGKGVYLSTDMEPDYGSCIFALDRDDVHAKELSECSNVNKQRVCQNSNSGKACWRALKEDFPVYREKKINAAYLVLKNPDDLQTIQSFLKQMDLEEPLEIVSYEEALEEQKMIQDLQGVFEPKAWSHAWDHLLISMYTSIQKCLAMARTADSSSSDDEWN